MIAGLCLGDRHVLCVALTVETASVSLANAKLHAMSALATQASRVKTKCWECKDR